MRKTTFGLSENVAIAIIYFLSFITGIIFLMNEKEDKNIRFHAMQSTILGIGFVILDIIVAVLSVIPILGAVISLVFGIVSLLFGVITIALVVLAFTGKDVRIPVIADLAEARI